MRWVIRLVIVAVLAAAAWVGLQSIPRGPQGPVVQLGTVSRPATFESFVTASGEIVATRYADIGSDIMGRIIDLPVKEGQAVREGQILARLDPVQASSELEAARAQVRVLEAEEAAARDLLDNAGFQLQRNQAIYREAVLRLERIQSLYDRELVPRAELDSAQAGYDAAKADVAAAEASVSRLEKSVLSARRRVAEAETRVAQASDLFSKTEIRAPISGVVSRLQVREGEMVVIGIQNQPGTTLMTISDLGGINAEVKVAEADILRVELGQEAVVTLDALPDRPFPGRVIEVGTSALTGVDATTAAREFRVVIELTEPARGLRPGLTCDAEVLTASLESPLTVPLQSVVLRDVDGMERTGVFLRDADRARFVPVETGIIGGLDIVVEGVDEGGEVVIGPYQVLRQLQDGDRIAFEPAG